LSGLSLLAHVVASISLFVGAGHLSIYLRRPEHRIYLTFALVCFGFGAYNGVAVGVYEATSPESLRYWLRFLFLALSLSTLAFVWFVSDYAGGRYSRIALWISIALLPPIVATAFGIDRLLWSGEAGFRTIELPFGLRVRQHVVPRGPILTYQVLPYLAAVSLAFFAGQALRRTGERKRGTLLVVTTALFLAAGLSDAAVLYGIYDFVYLYKFAFIFFILMMTWSFSGEVLSAIEVRAALAQSEERLELALEGANDGLWDWSPPTGEVHYSPRWFEMLGYRPGEIAPSFSAILDRLHPEDRRTFVARRERDLLAGDPFDTVVRMRHANGEYRQIRVRALVTRERDGRPLSLSGSLQDVTEPPY